MSGFSLVSAYESSNFYKQTEADLEAMIHQQQLDDRNVDERGQSVTYATNFLFQVIFLPYSHCL